MKSIVAFSTLFAFAFTGALIDARAWYTIYTTSDVAKYNNLYIGYKDRRVGAIRDTRESAARAQKFYTIPYPPENTLSLSTGDDAGVALRIIQTGIHTLVELGTQDEAARNGGLVEWSTFVINGDKTGGDAKEGAISIKDGQNVPTRRWILIEDSAEFYSINLYDGVSVFSQSYANITLVAKRTPPPPI